ncbi:bifunctional folylpolyglutamate synthase/dihydrofolate synthase [Pedobacter faecalis]|uniref:bifunctional folylpolyglutamate synthase/dihydrofolate synthase n=1 Tax=Pedobacter faecalis TaxID=3041495 RepID=UPI002550C292|nr:folylpolyglutamate synthase/dihydrofolate synthase family protein [Pedobacter sp. ELA7]
MDYEQTVDYLYSKLPMFTKVGSIAIKKDLHNIRSLCSRLNNPQSRFKSIHVGGTNGKGSTSHMLAAILQTAGYKTGLYTSPHLKDFRERIKVDGKMIGKQSVTNFITENRSFIETIEPSFFEVTVAMAFSYFAQEQVDVAIIEVGLGGRLDSTNIIMPELSVITNISLDHTSILGDTLKEIAYEKAGIIKPWIPAVIGESHPETDEVFERKANDAHAELHFADRHMQVERVTKAADFMDVAVAYASSMKELRLDLTGSYQLKNILTVLQSVEIMRTKGFQISDEALHYSLQHVKEITGLQGRWQKLGDHPLIFCDTGHNVAGISEIVTNIKALSYTNLHMVIGMVKDKDITGVLKLLPKDAIYYFCHPQLERALDSTELGAIAERYGLNGESYGSVQDAVRAAKTNAQKSDLIFIGGSTFVVAEAL